MMIATDKAKVKVVEVLTKKPGCAFRVAIQGGGCNGFQYQFLLDEQIDDDDILIDEIDGNKIVVDPMSAMYLENSTLDFKEEIFSQMFVINNPNVSGTCGCGSSMSF